MLFFKILTPYRRLHIVFLWLQNFNTSNQPIANPCFASQNLHIESYVHICMHIITTNSDSFCTNLRLTASFCFLHLELFLTSQYRTQHWNAMFGHSSIWDSHRIKFKDHTNLLQFASSMLIIQSMQQATSFLPKWLLVQCLVPSILSRSHI